MDSAGRYLTTFTPPQSDVEIQSLNLEENCAIAHSSVMMRSAPLKITGGYDESFNTAPDLSYGCRLGEVSDLANMRAVQLKYRQRNTAAFYGWQAIKANPFSMAGWGLLIVPLVKTLLSTGEC